MIRKYRHVFICRKWFRAPLALILIYAHALIIEGKLILEKLDHYTLCIRVKWLRVPLARISAPFLIIKAQLISERQVNYPVPAYRGISFLICWSIRIYTLYRKIARYIERETDSEKH